MIVEGLRVSQGRKLGSADIRRVATALVLGDVDALPDAVWDSFMNDPESYQHIECWCGRINHLLDQWLFEGDLAQQVLRAALRLPLTGIDLDACLTWIAYAPQIAAEIGGVPARRAIGDNLAEVFAHALLCEGTCSGELTSFLLSGRRGEKMKRRQHKHISGVSLVQAAASTLLARMGGYEPVYACTECGKLARREATALATRLGLQEMAKPVQVALLEGLRLGGKVSSMVGTTRGAARRAPVSWWAWHD